jgi:hypothetical protein
MRLLRWSSALLILAFALAGTSLAPTACNGSSSADGGEGGDESSGDDEDTGPLEASEPLICTEFTEAGAPCSLPSPVRCFPECETGGCSCTATAAGPRWRCQTDLSCMPDCAPVDDGCSPASPGEVDDAGSAADGGVDAAGLSTDGGVDAASE